MKITRRFTEAGQVALREHPIPARHQRDQEPGRLRRVQARRLHGARALEPGGERHHRAEVFPQGGRAEAAEEGRGDAGPVMAVALGPDERALGGARATASGSAARPTRGRCSTAWPAAGPTGAGRAATSRREEDARAFYDEHRYMLATQMARAEQPAVVQHRACTGRTASTGPAQGHFYVDPRTRRARSARASAYEHPQPHACFIQSINDDLVNDDGIMDLWVREARLFKYGSGTGSNFSKLRGERAAVGRRQVVGPDELPQDRRPRGRRDQVRRHHTPCGQDGGASTSITRTSRSSSTGR